MRVVLTSYAEKTHFLGLVPLAWALQTAGHEVRVASQPELTETVVGAGLTAVPIGRDHRLYRLLQWARARGQDEPGFDPGTMRQEDLDWERLRDGHREYVDHWWRVVNEPMLGELVRYCRSWRPDLVLWETGTFAGGLAASACGAVHGRFMWSVDIFGRTRRRFSELRSEQPPDAREDPVAEWLTDRAHRFGTEFSEELVTGQFTIDQTPGALRVDAGLDYLPMRYVPYGGRAVVPDWLRTPPRRPRVCLSLGTSATDRLGGYTVPVQELLHSLADLDIELIATLAPEEQAKLDHVPDNTRLVDYVPLDALMPTCSAIINHGGAGTMLTAARHGVPQLVVPHAMFDEALLAERIAEQGAGATPTGASGSAVADQLRALLNRPGFLDAAHGLREEMVRQPTPHTTAVRLEQRVAELR